MQSKSLLFGLGTFFIVLLLLLSNVSASTWQDSYTDGLVSYAKLSEGTGTVAYNTVTNTRYNWTIFNGQWNLTNYKFDYSYQFTGGNTYLQSVSPSNNQLANQTNLSYTMWLYPLDATNCFVTPYEGIFSISTTQFELSYSNSACELSLYTGTGGRLNSGKLIKPNKWNFVAITHTSGTSKIYINGTLVANATGKSWTDDSTGVFRWGRGGSGYYTGGMDELAIWNRTLSADEILNMYNSGVGMQPTIGVATLKSNQSYPSSDSIINATSIDFGCNFSSNYQNISTIVLNITNITTGIQVYSNISSISSGISSLNQSWSVTTLTNGIYNWTCTGYGNQGINATSLIRNFSLIYTAPYYSPYEPVNNTYTNNTAVTFSANTTLFNISNASLTIYNQSMYVINQTNYTGVNDTIWSGIVNLVQGAYMWIVTIVSDFADSATSGLYNLFVDTSAPNITISSPINGYYYNTTTIDLVYTIGDNFNLSANYTTGYPFSEGVNTFTVYANDTAGNLISNSTTFIVDTISPTIYINSPNLTNYSTTYINFNTTVNDTNLQTCMYSLNGAANTTYTCNTNLSLLAVQGTNTIYSFVNDSAGNWNSTSVSFNVDTVSPTIEIITPNGTNLYGFVGQNVSLNYSIIDNNIHSCWYNYGDVASNSIKYDNTIVGNNSFTFNTNISSSIGGDIKMLKAVGSQQYAIRNSNANVAVSVALDTPLCNFTNNSNYGMGVYSTELTNSVGKYFCVNVSNVLYLNRITAIDTFTPLSIFNTGCNTNSSIILTTGNYVTMYANDSYGNSENIYHTWNNDILLNSINYSNPIYETSSQTFILNASTSTNLVTAVLNYSGSNYNSNVNCSNYECIINNIIDIPLLNATSTTNFFFWNITVYNGSAYISSVTSIYNQTVLPINLSFCSSSASNISLNFTGYDEQNLTRFAVVQFDGSFDYWLGSGSSKKQTNISVNQSEIDLCFGQNSPYYLDAIIAYNPSPNTGYTARNYFYQAKTFNQTQTKVELYSLLTTAATGFILKVQNEEVQPAINMLVEVQRYYPGTATTKTMFIARTGILGTTYGDLEANSALYQFLITNQSQTLLYVTPADKVVPSTTPYTLLFQLGGVYSSPFINILNVTDITTNLYFNQTTQTVVLDYVDTSNSLHAVELKVVANNMSGTTYPVICDNYLYNLSIGQITCNVSGNGGYTATAYYYRSPARFAEQLVFVIQNVATTLGGYGFLLGFFILIICAFMFKYNEIAGIIMLNVGIIGVNMLGLIDFGYVFITSIILVSIIIISVIER